MWDFFCRFYFFVRFTWHLCCFPLQVFLAQFLRPVAPVCLSRPLRRATPQGGSPVILQWACMDMQYHGASRTPTAEQTLRMQWLVLVSFLEKLHYLLRTVVKATFTFWQFSMKCHLKIFPYTFTVLVYIGYISIWNARQKALCTLAPTICRCVEALMYEFGILTQY